MLRLLLATVLGGVVGIEREVAGHPAGLRTHISVALGAALFAAVSAYGFQHFQAVRADTNYQIDVTRVASQIVVGVGFLGGGTILKEGATVRGLTTAASLWVTAAIGTAAALGSAPLAVFTTLLLVGSLIVLRLPRRWIRTRVAQRRETVILRLHPHADPRPVLGALTGVDDVEVREVTVKEIDGVTQIHAYVVGAHGVDVDRALAGLAEREDVDGLDIA
jgi:putative Mg2+ transporter-C (MgtC) family protein